MPRKVWIASENEAWYEAMFITMGWGIAKRMADADLVQFTGGEDVSPFLYGEPKHPSSHCNKDRDMREKVIFEHALALKKPMAGICRGGQFLNVMCGGKMWQDVDRHALNGVHEVKDTLTHEIFSATSTHHQMMRPSPMGLVVAVAHPNRSTRRDYMGNHGSIISTFRDTDPEPEVVYYYDQEALCFQPHPEFGSDALRNKYFSYLETYLF